MNVPERKAKFKNRRNSTILFHYWQVIYFQYIFIGGHYILQLSDFLARMQIKLSHFLKKIIKVLLFYLFFQEQDTYLDYK